jgi:hypothetical protein
MKIEFIETLARVSLKFKNDLLDMNEEVPHILKVNNEI